MLFNKINKHFGLINLITASTGQMSTVLRVPYLGILQIGMSLLRTEKNELESVSVPLTTAGSRQSRVSKF